MVTCILLQVERKRLLCLLETKRQCPFWSFFVGHFHISELSIQLTWSIRFNPRNSCKLFIYLGCRAGRDAHHSMNSLALPLVWYTSFFLLALWHFLGSVPFILREHLSYSQLGVFALSNYPYSLKLLWSPIVDSTFLPSIGRRKSWIIPMQLIIGSLMLYIASNVGRLMENVRGNC